MKKTVEDYRNDIVFLKEDIKRLKDDVKHYKGMARCYERILTRLAKLTTTEKNAKAKLDKVQSQAEGVLDEYL